MSKQQWIENMASVATARFFFLLLVVVVVVDDIERRR